MACSLSVAPLLADSLAGRAGARAAVGTEIALRPPHRSRRALLTHRALALDGDEEPLLRPRMQDARIRQIGSAIPFIRSHVNRRARWLRRRRTLCHLSIMWCRKAVMAGALIGTA